MKTEEFRIGNCLQDRNGKLAIIEKLSKEDGIKAFSGMVTGLPLKPIPLTEEWLLKFGFDDSEYRNGYIGRTFKGGGVFLDFVLNKPLEKGPWNENFTFDLPNHRYVDVPYVHQLQNLFYSLTGEELKTK